MRLLHREPETPSLETWLSRDVPHEREMAGELLEKMGRDNALAALLAIHDREEKRRETKRKAILKTHLALSGAACVAFILVALKPLNLLPIGDAVFLIAAVFAVGTLISTAVQSRQQWNNFHDPSRQNMITALLNYDDPLVADPLCRALSYYSNEEDPWALFTHLSRTLTLLPDAKEALTEEARSRLKYRLWVLETKPPKDLTNEDKTNRAQQADFEIAVLRYFARTQDEKALSAIRKLAQAKTYSEDGERVRDAAQSALYSLLRSEP